MKLKPRQSHNLDAYLTEANALAVKKLFKKHSKTTIKVINRKLSSLLANVFASLFEPSEATLLSRQIHSYSTTLVSSFEELQRTAKMVESDLNNGTTNLAKKLKVLSIETRQLISQFLTTIDDYRRSSTKGGKLNLNGKVDLKQYAKTMAKLEEMEKLCDHASKAAAAIVIGDTNSAKKQLQPIIKAKF